MVNHLLGRRRSIRRSDPSTADRLQSGHALPIRHRPVLTNADIASQHQVRRSGFRRLGEATASATSASRLLASFDGQSEQWTQTRAQDAAGESRDQPEPAMQAAGRDAAEVCADVAAVGEAAP